MEPNVLTDKEQFPTEEVIYSYIGKKQQLWLGVFDYIHTNYPEFSEEWRYYNDGKTWLLKVTRKTKTIFWLSILKDTFRMTFYFTDKAEELINKSTITDDLKEQFFCGKKINKIRPITIVFKYKKDVENAKALMAIKLMIK